MTNTILKSVGYLSVLNATKRCLLIEKSIKKTYFTSVFVASTILNCPAWMFKKKKPVKIRMLQLKVRVIFSAALNRKRLVVI